MKNPKNLNLVVILLIINSLSVVTMANEVFTYNVQTGINELTVTQTANGVKYSFDNPSYLENEGYPELPYKTVTLALPSNTEVVSIEAAGAQILTAASNINMLWCEGDIVTDINVVYTPASKNQAAYQSSSLYPGKYAELLSHGYMGSQHLASIAVYPVQYRASTGEVILVGDIEITVNLESKAMSTSKTANAGSALLNRLVNNPSDLPTQSPVITSGGGLIPGDAILGLGAEYLVITSSELASAFYPFVVWKNQKGILTEIVLIEDILARYSGVDDAERLREYLKDAHNEGAQYVLLGGDEDIIPIRYAYPGNVSSVPVLTSQQISDLYFADLTGNWDVDGDGIYGESTQDSPDTYPEVYVGRIPAESVADVEHWVSKTLIYEQNPNNGDYSYLTKGLFITADQMRDLNEHVTLAGLMPDNFTVDYSRCAEEPSGSSTSPTQPSAEEVVEVMDEGWGFISNLNHGDFAFYATRSVGANASSLSNLFGDTLTGGNGACALTHLTDNTAYSVHYSISCYNAAYDFDKGIFWPGPFLTENTHMEAFLFLPNKGGVAYLGNTRWGWVSGSFSLEKKFIEYVFSDTARQLSVAETLSKLYYPAKRDLGYGHTLFGDPELSIWAVTPSRLTVSVPDEITIDSSSISVLVSNGSGAASNTKVTVWKPGELYYRGYTDSNGRLSVPLSLTDAGNIYVTAIAQDFVPAIDTIHIYSQSAIDDDENDALPSVAYLNSNYPNPFNSSTEIKFGLPASGMAELNLYDISGRKVKTLVEGNLAAGQHTVIWDGCNDSGDLVASGAYFYKLKTDSANLTKKMVFLK